MSENANGWPDPARPGVPVNAEKAGWHWVQRIDDGFERPLSVLLWTDDWNGWMGFAWDAMGYQPDEKFGQDFRYLGPCLTPDEVEAIKDARWHEGYSACYTDLQKGVSFGSPDTHFGNALKWREAVNHALTNWLSPIEIHETPWDALQRLIRLEVMAALDPAVSKSASDLVAEARRAALEEAAQVAEGKVYKQLYRTWPWWINRDGSEGNRSSDSDLVQHADKIAEAIRALGEKE